VGIDAADVRFAHNQDRVAYRSALDRLIGNALAGASRETWLARFADHGIPCGRGPVTRPCLRQRSGARTGTQASGPWTHRVPRAAAAFCPQPFSVAHGAANTRPSTAPQSERRMRRPRLERSRTLSSAGRVDL
jgi:crotonobetainyl-CoA:carnitine CoA-transferase CaiB-like acyl-CoA transferase